MTLRREVFEGEKGHEIWIEGNSDLRDMNILLTLSTQSGEDTALITGSTITMSQAKLFVEAPPERIASPVTARLERVKAIGKWTGYALSILLITFSALSFSGVVKARIVLTGSMAPSINVGDVIVTTATKYHTPRKGDIIAYTARRFNGAEVATVSHRIIGGDAEKGFIVKGDLNKLPDVQRPKLPDIKGVVILVLPFIGNLLTPKSLFLIVPSIFGLWLILDAMRNAE